MRVVFLEDVPNVALAGEVKEVKDGFARNYLLPRHLAALPTKDQLQRVNVLKRAAVVKRQEESQVLDALAQRLQGVTVTIRARATAEGTLYGSVSGATLAQELSKLVGQEVPRQTIELPETIKQLGIYDVPIRLSQDLRTTVKVNVELEEVGGPVARQEEGSVPSEPPSDIEEEKG